MVCFWNNPFVWRISDTSIVWNSSLFWWYIRSHGHGHLCSLWLRGQCARVHRADSLALQFRCTENMINDIFHLFSMMIIYTPFALQARISPSTALQKCRGQQFSFIFSLLFFFANNFYLHICLPKIKEKKKNGEWGKRGSRTEDIYNKRKGKFATLMDDE